MNALNVKICESLQSSSSSSIMAYLESQTLRNEKEIQLVH